MHTFITAVNIQKKREINKYLTLNYVKQILLELGY